MANTLRFKRGLVSGIPTAALGEPLFTTDTFDLYIGNGTGNTRFQKYIASGTTSQILRGDGSLYNFPLNITSPSNGQVLKFNGTNWVNDSDAGITGSGASGQVAYFTGATTQGGSNNLFWDSANSRLGIGTNTPARPLHIVNTAAQIRISDTIAPTTNYWEFLSTFSTSNQDLFINNQNGTAIKLSASRNMMVGTTTDNGARLQVSGTSTFSGAMTIGANSNLSFNQNGGSFFRVQNTTSGTGSYSELIVQSDASSGSGSLGKVSSAYTTYKLLTPSTTYIYNGTAGNIAILNDFASGSIVMAAGGSSTAQLTLNSSGNLGLGVTPSAWSSLFKGFQIGAGGALWAHATDVRYTYLSNNLYYDGSFKYLGTAASTLYTQELGQHKWFNAPSGTAGNAITFTQAMTLYSTGNLAIGSAASDTGQRLQVTGTSMLNGNVTFGSSVSTGIGMFWNNATNRLGIGFASPESELYIRNTINTTLTIHSTEPGSNATPVESKIKFRGYAANTQAEIAAQSRASNVTGGWLYFRTADSSAVLQDRLIIANTGAATFSSSVTASGNLLLTAGTASSVGAINLIRTGTSPVASRLTFGTDGTGYSFAIGKNQGGSVTDYFTILDSGAATFSGTLTVSGGNGYQLINSASTTVTALRPTGGGTSIMSTNSNGIHIAVGTQANGDLILATNNTERLRLYRDGYLIHTSATNPTTSSTDAYLQYSADVVAGNAAPHFRTENGAVIKLYQETTSVGNSIISLGGGNAVLDDTTFDGYTLRQIVKALRNQGILA